MAENTNEIRCPDCNGTRLEKYGHGAKGRQKWRCLGSDARPDCRRQFTAGQTHLISEETLALAKRMLDAGIHPVKIKEALGPDIKISRRWLYELARKQKSQ